MKDLMQVGLIFLFLPLSCDPSQSRGNLEAAMHYSYTISADYFTLYFVDENMQWYHPDMWSEKVYAEERVAVARGVIGISTARNFSVPVEVDVLDSEPREPFDGWDQVVDCSIDIRSGKMVIGGPGLDDVDVQRIPLRPGTYRARIFFGGLNTLSRDGTEGDDRYRIVLWLGKATPVTIIKKCNYSAPPLCQSKKKAKTKGRKFSSLPSPDD